MPLLDVRDLRIYYELHGAPGALALVLLNGALDTIESDWAHQLPALAERYRVLVYDHRGHGRTSRSAEPFASYDQLADDLAGLLDGLGLARAHFCGFSDGGITLLYFALRWPARVCSLTLVGAQYTNDERTLALLAKMTPERIVARLPEWAARLAQLHDTHHTPGYWQALMRQMLALWPVQPSLTLGQLAQISAPVLLIAGERDGFGHIDQQVAMRRALPQAQLCILPAAGHPVMNEQPDLFRIALLQFLHDNETL